MDCPKGAHMNRRLSAFTVVLCVLATLTWVAQARAQGQLTYAPKRITLPRVVGDLLQCSIRVDPDALLAAHARYCDAYTAAYTLLDQEHGRRFAGTEASERVLPTTKEVQRQIQDGKVSLAQTISLADAFLDDLQASISADQLEAFQRFRNECHVRLLVAQIEGVASTYDLNVPQDIGDWIFAALDPTGGGAQERANIAQARLAHSAERRTVLRDLLQAVDETRLQWARLADELGVGGLSRHDAYERMAQAAQAPRQRGEQTWAAQLDGAGRISPQARARIVAVELKAWKAAAPLLPAHARHYVASTFLDVLVGGGGQLGRFSRLPPQLVRIHYGGGLDTIRLALSLPGQTSEQKAALRVACAAWLDARTAEYVRLAELAAHPEYSGEPDPAGMAQLDADFSQKIAAIAKAPWLNPPAQDLTIRQPRIQQTPQAPPVDLPKPEELALSPEDNASFPLPSPAFSWQYTRSFDRSDYQARHGGWPAAPLPNFEQDSESRLATQDDQRLVIQSICADFRSDWEAHVQPLLAKAMQDHQEWTDGRSWPNDPAERARVMAKNRVAAAKAATSRDRVWEEANKALRSLSDRLRAAAAPEHADLAGAWGAQWQLWMPLPLRTGWQRSMPNLPEAAQSQWLSKEARQVAAKALMSTWDTAVERAYAFHKAMLRASSLDPSFTLEFDENGVSRPGDRPMDRMIEQSQRARDSYLALVSSDEDRVAELLSQSDAAMWRSVLREQRTPFAYFTLTDLLRALPDTPENSAARAAVLAEHQTLVAMCDRAGTILAQLPEISPKMFGGINGPNSQLHVRAKVYSDLAMDLRTQALWRLRNKVPADVVDRVPLLRQADTLKALAAGPTS
jgi:hypothetical protein